MPDWAITIAKVDGNLTFSPNPQIVLAGDNLYWRNTDDVDHWPKITGESNTSMLQYKIPPDGTSSFYSVPSSITDADISYSCSLEPGEEATIKAYTAPEPEPEPKKSAFAADMPGQAS